MADLIGGTVSGNPFNQDIDGWNVANVRSTARAFSELSHFNAPLNTWDTSAVTDTSGMFAKAIVFNQDLNAWDMSSMTDISWILYRALSFNATLAAWDVSAVQTTNRAFSGAPKFNQDLSAWDMSSVTDIDQMFRKCLQFNGELSAWDTSSVVTMERTFESALVYNQDLSRWDVSSVMDFRYFFSLRRIEDNPGLANPESRAATPERSPVNITGWDTSRARYMDGMFRECSHVPIGLPRLDLQRLERADAMFGGCTAPEPHFMLQGWNVGRVTSIARMFADIRAPLRANLSGWNTTSLTNITGLFENTTFDIEGRSPSRQELLVFLGMDAWNLSSITHRENFLPLASF